MNQKKLKLINKNNEYFLWQPYDSSIYKINKKIAQALKSDEGFTEIPKDAPINQKQLLTELIGYSKIPEVVYSSDVKTMILHSTWKCNLKCKYCYLDIDDVDKKDMPLENILSAIEQFSKCGGLFLDISGGEPLLRKDLSQIAKTSYESALRVTIVTNGTLLSAENINELKDYVHQISISIDGIGKTHDSLRGYGTYKKLEDSLQLLNKYSIQTGVTTVVTNNNIMELPELYSFLSSKEVKQWNLTLLRATGRARNEKVNRGQVFIDDFLKTISDDEKMEIVIDESLLGPKLRSVLKEKYLWKEYARWHNTLTVLPNGDCVACVFFPKIVYGNILKNSIPEIYESPVRKEVLASKKPCDSCPLAL